MLQSRSLLARSRIFAAGPSVAARQAFLARRAAAAQPGLTQVACMQVATVPARQGERTNARQPWKTLMAAPLLLMLIAYAREREDSIAYCEDPGRADRIRGGYENKIRFFSPPEKAFEIFASKKLDDGELCMTYSDFLRAVTPYCHTAYFEGTDEYLKENTPEILKLVDADGDGDISFTEYVFFLVLLQANSSNLRRVFREACKDLGTSLGKDKSVPVEHASALLRKLRLKTTAGKRQQDKVKFDPRAIKASDEDFTRTNEQLVSFLFKDQEQVSLRDFAELQDRFKASLYHYWFHSLEPDSRGRISTENFLKANLSALDSSQQGKYIRQIAKVCKDVDIDPGVGEQEFIAFQAFIDQLDLFKAKVSQARFLNIDEYAEQVAIISKGTRYCQETKAKISEHQLSVFFGMLDLDESGDLSPEEILLFDRRSFNQAKEEQVKNNLMDGARWARKTVVDTVESITGFKLPL